MNLLTKIIQKADSLVGYPLNRIRYAFCKLSGRPYFGPLYAARQGIPERYEHMRVIAKQNVPDGGRILEIGSWAGGSARVLAEALPYARIHCIDPWIQYFDPASRNPIHRAMNKAARRGAVLPLFLHNTRRFHDRINVFMGKSIEILPLLGHRIYNLIYIDGDHSFESVLFDLNQSGYLLIDNGILCGDDLELQWDEVDTFNLQVNLSEDYVPDTKTDQYYHPGVTMAVWNYFNRRISARDGFWAVRKNGKEWEDVTW